LEDEEKIGDYEITYLVDVLSLFACTTIKSQALRDRKTKIQKSTTTLLIRIP